MKFPAARDPGLSMASTRLFETEYCLALNVNRSKTVLKLSTFIVLLCNWLMVRSSSLQSTEGLHPPVDKAQDPGNRCEYMQRDGLVRGRCATQIINCFTHSSSVSIKESVASGPFPSGPALSAPPVIARVAFLARHQGLFGHRPRP